MRKYLIFLLLIGYISCVSKTNSETSTIESKPLVIGDKEMVCFVYHRFGDSRFPSTNITTKDFEAHLKYLKENDFQVLGITEAMNYMASKAEVKKTAIITIDDGFKSFYKNGLPLLKKYDFPAVLFINTETVGGSDYMNWGQIKEATQHKIEIGNHTHSHDYFLNLDDSIRHSRFKQDIEIAQRTIKQRLDIEPISFAYPYGELDTKMRETVEKFGFKIGFAQNSGVISAFTNWMRCPRFPMSQSYSALDKFAAKAKTKALPVSKEIPSTFLMSKDKPSPELTIEFNGEGLLLNQLQCFIQGNQCTQKLTIGADNIVTLTLKPSTPINQRRRTLYTVTVPDKEGNWYWFSHLWINTG